MKTSSEIPLRSAASERADGDAIPCPLDGVRIDMLGVEGAGLSLQRQGNTVVVQPSSPMPQRVTIRPVALFRQDRGFPDVNTVMGRLVFPRGSTEGQSYRPFTLDPERRLSELFLPVETMPGDDWPVSAKRWRNFEAVARRLLAAAEIPWGGLTEKDVEELVRFVPWPEPLEGCLLHALTQWTHQLGRCVIEIGSLRGRSASMLAMALRGAQSESLLISIDPHAESPYNLNQVGLALRQIGQEKRLVQIKTTSDRGCRLLEASCASLIFVDGDHSYDQVIADFNNYRDLLAPGGCMVFHDYCYGNHNGLPEADPDVRRAVDEQVMHASDFRPLLLAHTQFAFVKDRAEGEAGGRLKGTARRLVDDQG